MTSVVIPAYNRREFIGETVDSVLAQTYKELEVLVVDDGSTDGTGEYLKSRYAGESRFRYIWQENAERSVARNTGIKAAKGEYVAFLDSDDLWMPEKLDAQIGLLVSNPDMVMAVTWFELIDEQGMVLQAVESPRMDDVAGLDFATRMLEKNRIGSPTPVIKRQVLFDAGMFCPDFTQGEDWELWTRVSVFGKVGVVPRVLARHRIHSGNTEKPFTFENYLAAVVNIKRQLGETRWNTLKDEAMRSYWTRLRDTPPHFLNPRMKALASGALVFGCGFFTAAIGAFRLDLIRLLIGPGTLSRLRKLRAGRSLSRS